MRRKRCWIAEPMDGRVLLSGLMYSLTTDQTAYQFGQPIEMTFSETNTGDQPVTVELNPTDFTVTLDDGSFLSTVWQSDAENQGAAPETEPLQPGQSVAQTATWDGSSTDITNLASDMYGTYDVTSTNAPEGTSAVFQIASPIRDALTTDQSTYQFGQPVQISFTRTNTSDEPVPFSLNMASDLFEVDTQDGQMVWQSDQSTPLTEAPYEYPLILQPGQSWTKTVTWGGWINESSAWGSLERTAESATGSFGVSSQLDPAGPFASFQIQSPLSYSLTESQTELQFCQPNYDTYTITNPSDQAVTFNLPPADFVVTWKGSPIWESDPGAASQPIAIETLGPGQSLTESATWNGMANLGPLANTDVFGNSNDYFTVSVLGVPANTDVAFNIANPLSGNVTASGGNGTGAETFLPGQSIVFTATETNTGDLPVTIQNSDDNFGMQYQTSTTPQYITQFGLQHVITRIDHNITIPASNTAPVGQVVTLQPGQSQAFTATWDPSSDPDLPSGSLMYASYFQDNYYSTMVSFLEIDTPASPVNKTSSIQGTSPLVATLSTSHRTDPQGVALRITLTLENVSKEKVRLAPFAGRAEITLLRGSSVVATARKRLSFAKAATLKPERDLHLTTELEVRHLRAAVRARVPGTYTIEIEDGGFTAATSLEI